MKNLLFIILTALVFISCENTETNSPALQAKIENVLFKSDFTEANYITNGDYFIIQAKSDDEILTLRASYPPAEVDLEFGDNSENFATFERANGVVYSTINEGGNGRMIISNISTSSRLITGDFNFTAVSTGLDTITVSSGIFFQVPYEAGSDDSSNAGSFSSQINGNSFTPLDVFANKSGNSIIIKGVIDSEKITITVPSDVAVGDYDVLQNGFSAKYENNSETEEALEGSVAIVFHNVENRKIFGTFSFVTETNTITLGQFNVTYQ